MALSVPIVDTDLEPSSELATVDHTNTRSEAERIRDLETISKLYLRGAKPAEIANELVKQYGYRNISGQMIVYELAKLRRMWVQSALIDYDEAKAREIAHIDELESAAWEGWKRSWERSKVEVREAIEDHFGHGRPKAIPDEQTDSEGKKPTTYTRKRSTETAKEQFGDPRFLDTIKWCIEQRCKVLGLHEPTRISLTWHDEAAKAGIDPDTAKQIYDQILSNTTKMVRDQVLKSNELPIPDDVLDGEFNDDIADDIPDEFK